MCTVVGAPRIPCRKYMPSSIFFLGGRGDNAVLVADELGRSDGLIRTVGHHRPSPPRYPAVLCHGWRVLD